MQRIGVTGKCPVADNCPHFMEPGITNADRIRMMTDAELSMYLADIANCCACPINPRCNAEERCEKQWASYLKSKELG